MTVIYMGWTALMLNQPALPPPPSNYVKPDAIAAWQQKEAEKLNDLPGIPYLARLTSWHLLVCHAAEEDEEEISVGGTDASGLVSQLLAHTTAGDIEPYLTAGLRTETRRAKRLAIVGVDPRRGLRIAAGDLHQADQQVPAGLWNDPPAWDPYHAAVLDPDRRYLPRDRWSALLHVSWPGDRATAPQQAEWARRISHRLGLFGD